MKVFYETTPTRDHPGQEVAVIRLGSRARHALTCAESGCKDLVVGLQDNSGFQPSRQEGPQGRDATEAAKWADVIYPRPRREAGRALFQRDRAPYS